MSDNDEKEVEVDVEVDLEAGADDDEFAEQRAQDAEQEEEREHEEEREQEVEEGDEDGDNRSDEFDDDQPPPINDRGAAEDSDDVEEDGREHDEVLDTDEEAADEAKEIEEQDVKRAPVESFGETEGDLDGDDKLPLEDDSERGSEEGPGKDLKPALAQKPDFVDTDDSGEWSNRKKLCVLFGMLCPFILLMLILGLVFSVDTVPLGDVKLITDVPTPSPTETIVPTTVPDTPAPSPPGTATPAPTGEDETFVPTASPVVPPTVSPTPEANPTPSPTFGPLGQSSLGCDFIRIQENVTEGNFGENNFKVYPAGDTEICGDTFGGPDPERPNRNHWSVRYGRRDCVKRGYNEGTELCLFIGARRCSVEEFTAGVASGTGCGGDRELLYTGSQCQHPQSGETGIYMFNVGLNTTKQPFITCETDLSTPSIIRCCGDLEGKDDP